MSAHKDWQPEKVRSGLNHPVIDGDGHWIEYGPVFAEQVRKAAGDKAADGLLRHMRRIPDALSLSVADRRGRGIAMEGYWGRQSTNTRDRATAMMPRMLYDRRDLSDRRPRHCTHRRRRDPARGGSRLQYHHRQLFP